MILYEIYRITQTRPDDNPKWFDEIDKVIENYFKKIKEKT